MVASLTLIFCDGAASHEQLYPTILTTFQHFGGNLPFAYAKRLTFAAVVKYAFFPPDYVSGDKVLSLYPLLHAVLFRAATGRIGNPSAPAATVALALLRFEARQFLTSHLGNRFKGLYSCPSLFRVNAMVFMRNDVSERIHFRPRQS